MRKKKKRRRMQGEESRTPVPSDSLSWTIVVLLKSLTFCVPSLRAVILNGCPMAFELLCGTVEASAIRSRC